MAYQKKELTDCVILSSAVAPQASVIWLHGLGADGHDFVSIVPELRLDDALGIRFVFPHARLRPVTINNGYVMRAWYDIKMSALQGDEDDAGIRESEKIIRNFIQIERDAGIPADQIVLAGFSQGGAMALHTALRYPQRLAGIMALSSYLPVRGSIKSELANANRETPILMCHGTQDSVVPMQLGELSRDALTALGCTVQWKTYPMAHEVSFPQIADIAAWLRERLPGKK